MNRSEETPFPPSRPVPSPVSLPACLSNNHPKHGVPYQNGENREGKTVK